MKRFLSFILFLVPGSVLAIEPGIATLLGYTQDVEGITFRVPSGGCTFKDSFAVHRNASDLNEILLVRTRADHCKGIVPHGAEIHFTFAEVGAAPGDELRVGNPTATSFGDEE